MKTKSALPSPHLGGSIGRGPEGPRAERARIAEEALSSLEESEEEAVAAWAHELERRSREISEGRVQAVDWETTRDRILGELGKRRASRSSS